MAINVTGQRIDKGSNYRPWITFRDLTRIQGLDFLELLEIDELNFQNCVFKSSEKPTKCFPGFLH